MSEGAATTSPALLVPMRKLALALLAIVCSAGLGVLFDFVPRLQAITLGVVFLAMCGVIIAFEAFGRGRADLFSPLSLVTMYHAVGFGLKGLLDLATGASKIASALDPTSAQFAELMLRVYGYAILGIVCLVVGDRLARRHEAPMQVRPPAPLLAARGVKVAVILGMCLTFGAVSLMMVKFGTVVFTDPTYIAVRGTFGLFWLYPLMYAAVYAWALVPANRWAAGLHARRWQMTVGAVLAAIVYVVTSSKAILVIAMLVLVITYHRSVKPVRMSVLFALAGAFLLGLPVLYVHRQSGLTLEALARLSPAMLLAGAQIFLGRAYLADSFAAVLLYTPRVYPYQLGQRWLEVFYFWVPRSIWPDKPLSVGLEFGHTYLSSFFDRQESFYSPTLLGDAFMNFGPIGIVFVFLTLGYVLRRWYRWSFGPAARPESVVLYAITAYSIGIGAEQPFAGAVALALSYGGIGVMLAFVARATPQAFMARYVARREGGRSSGTAEVPAPPTPQ